MEMVGGPARLHWGYHLVRQCRQPAAADPADQHRTLRRDPVELPRALARRIQCAHFACARSGRGPGGGEGCQTTEGDGGGVMSRHGASRVAALGAAAGLVTCLVTGLATGAQAQSPKLWRHGIIEPKSDAGLVLMVAQKDFAERFGLKIDVV